MIQYATKAIQLLQQGMTCIPHTGKSPNVPKWPEIRNLTQQQITAWEQEGRWNNIGLLCGEASGNLVAIDFDGMEGYALFKINFPELVQTRTVATGSGNGMHVYFKCDLLPKSLSITNIEVVKPNEDGEVTDEKAKVNIEFRADGRCVIIPPSIHPETHKPYTVAIDAPIMQVSDLSRVVSWAKALKPEQEWQEPKPHNTTYSADLNPKLLETVERYFLSLPHKMSHEWINLSCPNTTAHKHGDKNFSFGYKPSIGFGYCYVCGDMNLKTLLPLIGMDARDFGGIYERKEQEEPAPLDRIPTAIAQPRIPPAATPAPTKAIPVVKRSKRLTHYIERLLDEDTPIEHPPIHFPLRALHRFGGMAQIIKPGKMVGIVGMSGGGKTSMLETMVDGLLDVNASCLVWSPEWSADEFIERSVQRYGGPTASELYLHEAYIHEQQKGIKNGLGRKLPQSKIDAAKEAIKILRGWEGSEVGYLKMPSLTVRTLKESMSDTLASIDFKPQVLVLDYIQLLHALDPDHYITMYNLAMQIKALCEEFDIIPFIASQVTKADTKGNKKNGDLLDATSARYVNDDPFNLFITINPDIITKTGERLPSAVLNVVKNSMGRPGKVRVGVTWEKLLFSQEASLHQGKIEGVDHDDLDEEEEEEKPKRRRRTKPTEEWIKS